MEEFSCRQVEHIHECAEWNRERVKLYRKITGLEEWDFNWQASWDRVGLEERMEAVLPEEFKRINAPKL